MHTSGQWAGKCAWFGPTSLSFWSVAKFANTLSSKFVGLDELFHALRAGRPGAEQALGRALSRELRHYFSRRFGPSDAEDLAQTTFAVIWAKWAVFEPRGPDSFRRWVFAIATREAKAARRVQQLRAGRFVKPEGSHRAPGTSPSAHARGLEFAERVRDELEQLNDDYRRAIESEVAEGDLRDFAAVEGVAPGTVRTRRHRGRAQLRARLRAFVEDTPPPS